MRQIVVLKLVASVFLLIPYVASAQQNEVPVVTEEAEHATAIVIGIRSETNETFAGFERLAQQVEFRIQSGTYAGEEFTATNGVFKGQEESKMKVGDRIVVERMVQPDGTIRHLLRDPYRLPSIFWLAVIFLLLSVLFGGIRSLSSVLGLCVSASILIFFVIPRIADGADPLLTSLIGSYVIAFTSLYLAHGFNRRTTVALWSTCATLAVAAITSYVAVHATSLFGIGSEESIYLIGGTNAIDLRGLLIGGFIIGTLGVLDDITTAQSAVVDEISKANPSLTSSQLLYAGMSVGREHIASLVNTLALAYIGASLPLFLLFHRADGLPLWLVANSESIAEEIVRTLIGSTALLLAVPISTWSAAKFLRHRGAPIAIDHSHCGHHHHHH